MLQTEPPDEIYSKKLQKISLWVKAMFKKG